MSTLHPPEASSQTSPNSSSSASPPASSQPPRDPPGASPKPDNCPISQNPGRHYRLLPHAEWVQFCHAVGVFKDDESEEVIRQTSGRWPPKGFRDGLYRDVLTEKTKSSFWFRGVSSVHWAIILLQIVISAVLTALGSMPIKNRVAITATAAVNTCLGGILALMHNSGLPDRYRSDANEFDKVEEHLRCIVDTAVVPADKDINEVITGCFDMFRDAMQTVQNNVPASYVTAPAGGNTPASQPVKSTRSTK
ncbi:hypothetical protein GGS23DRAFT_407004 [Durotheca rogersii]|uniref:uncharacterized protein n=1 Tax=Durotheca rogersii TaxID=419775 RepID=UPI0022201E72|nr:uncharacterized protein GGS23DRAFT_407004 [Durotheca rogersii]KAI5865060.1 hypothetical protein GGS23DRAFT_407004 [Durotheca rogersii]